MQTEHDSRDLSLAWSGIALEAERCVHWAKNGGAIVKATVATNASCTPRLAHGLQKGTLARSERMAQRAAPAQGNPLTQTLTAALDDPRYFAGSFDAAVLGTSGACS